MVPLNSKIVTSTYAIFGKRVLFTNIAKNLLRELPVSKIGQNTAY